MIKTPPQSGHCLFSSKTDLTLFYHCHSHNAPDTKPEFRNSASVTQLFTGHMIYYVLGTLPHVGVK